MKISNKAVITFLFRAHIVMLILSIIILIFLLLCSPKIFRNIRYVGFLFIIYTVIKILRLKYIFYENSGELLSIKSYYMFRKKNTLRHIEVPLEKVKQLYLDKIFFINYLIIKIQKNDERIIQIHFPITNMKKKDLLTIEHIFKNEL